MGFRAEPSGQNPHLNPIEAGMTDLLLRGENRTVRSFKGRREGCGGGGNLQLSGETSQMIRGRRECGSAREAVIHISAANQRRRHCCSEEKRRIHPKRAEDGEEKSIFDFLTVKLFMETFD